MTALAALIRSVSNASNNPELREWGQGEDGWESIVPSGVKVTRETAMQLSAVWACVRLLSDTISTLPVGTFRREEDQRIPVSPRPSWLDQPNPVQTRVEFVEQQVGSLLLDGNAFVRTIRNPLGDPAELWVVHPDLVQIRRVGSRIVYDVADPETGVARTLDEFQMFHIACFAWPGQIRGISPIEHARRVIGLGLASQEFAERFYGQGMHPAGVLEGKEELTPEQGKEIKRDFVRAASGVRNSHLPIVLSGGFTWKPLTITPEQGQFLESRKYSVAEIARWFRVPPHLIADVERSTSWGTGIEEQNIGFVQYGIRHWLERIEQAWTRHLLFFNRDEFVKFNVDGLLRGDQKSRFEAYAMGRQWGWLNADEIRAREDLPPLPDGAGREYLIPTTHRGADDEPEAQEPA
ncbi:MAG TPA: phage portal protein [Acidimicrobiia bacterium]